MTDNSLFAHLAATDDSAQIAARTATAVANKRVKDRFGPFLANAGDHVERAARLALVDDEIVTIVREVVAEYGGDTDRITAAIKRSLGEMGGMGMGGGQPGGMGSAIGMPGAQSPGAPGAMQPSGQQSCPQCGGPMVNGACPACQGGAAGAAAGSAGGSAPMGYGMNHTIPAGPSSGPIQAHTAKGGYCDKCKTWKHKGDCTCEAEAVDAEEGTDSDGGADDGGSATSSFRTARRPKLCPYHSEVVDISLGSGEPQAGFNAMSSHAWGDQHCKGAYDGSCNFRPAMVTTKYWDDKRVEYDERRQQRELERQTPSEPELSIDSEPIMHAEPLPNEPGKEGVSDIDGELANAPSAVGSGDLAIAASTHKEAEALKTVKLPKGNDDAHGGPSPKLDKGNSGDQFSWSLEDIDTDMDGTPHPTVKQDPTDKADYNKKDFRDQTRAVTETVELDSALNLMDDAGFAPGGEEHGPHTDTWHGTDGLAKPVTRDALSAAKVNCEQCENRVAKGATKVVDGLRLCSDCRGSDTPDQEQRSDLERESAVDPDKNPLRTILDEHQGFLMPHDVTAALRAWDVG